MSPHALRQRMRHGNVYPPERTAVALDRFFTEANLTALRELSLRLVAQRVEGQLEGTAARAAAAARDRPRDRARRRQPRVAAGHPPGGQAGGGAPRRARRGRRRDAGAERLPFDRRATSRRRSTMRWTSARTSSGSRRPDEAPWNGRPEPAGHAHRGSLARLGGFDRLRRRPLAEQLIERLPDVEIHLVARKTERDGR